MPLRHQITSFFTCFNAHLAPDVGLHSADAHPKRTASQRLSRASTRTSLACETKPFQTHLEHLDDSANHAWTPVVPQLFQHEGERLPLVSLDRLHKQLEGTVSLIAVVRIAPPPLSSAAAAVVQPPVSPQVSSTSPVSAVAMHSLSSLSRMSPRRPSPSPSSSRVHPVAATAGEQPHHTATSLQPVFVSEAAFMSFGIGAYTDYGDVLASIVADDGGLRRVLDEATAGALAALAGRGGSSGGGGSSDQASEQAGCLVRVHKFAHPLRVGCTHLSAVRVTQCALEAPPAAAVGSIGSIEDDDQPVLVLSSLSDSLGGGDSSRRGRRGGASGAEVLMLPALHIEHVLDDGPGRPGISQEVALCHHMMLSRVSAILTLFDLNHGAVLQQNESSVRYMGNLVASRCSAGSSTGSSSRPTVLLPAGAKAKACAIGATNVLQALFRLDPEKLEEMLDALSDDVNAEWRGMVRVPLPSPQHPSPFCQQHVWPSEESLVAALLEEAAVSPRAPSSPAAAAAAGHSYAQHRGGRLPIQIPASETILRTSTQQPSRLACPSTSPRPTHLPLQPAPSFSSSMRRIGSTGDIAQLADAPSCASPFAISSNKSFSARRNTITSQQQLQLQRGGDSLSKYETSSQGGSRWRSSAVVAGAACDDCDGALDELYHLRANSERLPPSRAALLLRRSTQQRRHAAGATTGAHSDLQVRRSETSLGSTASFATTGAERCATSGRAPDRAWTSNSATLPLRADSTDLSEDGDASVTDGASLHGGGGGGGRGGAGGKGIPGAEFVRAGSLVGGAQRGSGGGCGRGSSGGAMGSTASGGGGGSYLWHEMTAVLFRDPVSRKQVVLLTQTDVTAKVAAEERLAALTEAAVAMLELIFPCHVIEHMTQQGALAARCATGDAAACAMRDMGTLETKHPQVTILFADCVGFTAMAKDAAPEAVMRFLHQLYTKFDDLLDVHGVYKVETVGDCYVVAGGLIKTDEEGFACVNDGPDGGSARSVFSFAKAMLRAASTVMLPNGEPLRMRVGLHTGPVVSGVVGRRMPKFVLVGDTMNTASRMESTCPVGCIQVSSDTRALLLSDKDAALQLTYTGGVDVKGKGHMDTYVFNPQSGTTTTCLPQQPQHMQPPRRPDVLQQHQLDNVPSRDTSNSTLLDMPSLHLIHDHPSDDVLGGLSISGGGGGGGSAWDTHTSRRSPSRPAGIAGGGGGSVRAAPIRHNSVQLNWLDVMLGRLLPQTAAAPPLVPQGRRASLMMTAAAAGGRLAAVPPLTLLPQGGGLSLRGSVECGAATAAAGATAPARRRSTLLNFHEIMHRVHNQYNIDSNFNSNANVNSITNNNKGTTGTSSPQNTAAATSKGM